MDNLLILEIVMKLLLNVPLFILLGVLIAEYRKKKEKIYLYLFILLGLCIIAMLYIPLQSRELTVE